ncbi:hypothetical protein NP493_106g07066 [Ridgeia piscesae]|uniref:Uncharacterized protein n=1 Tax=Ridgeia piscesae TaxID=27915 RepID=A0AAD9UHA2_RIDPI|nr:hypothetical protein NP493_106g07066 [Ridgeia piscesae]
MWHHELRHYVLVRLRRAVKEMCHGIRLDIGDRILASLTNSYLRRTSRFVVEVFIIRDVCWRMKMAGMTRRSSLGNSQIHKTQDSLDRLRRLYPAVIDPENTLPRSWSPKDKHNFIGLTQNDLRVHYKGVGKTHKDAASVRATQPIPAACGIYYFEIKIISKGRDG